MDPRYESLLAELDRLRAAARAAGDANGGMVKSLERLKLEEELRIKQLSKATGISEKELAAREKVAKAADEAAMSEVRRTQAADKSAKESEARQAERDKKQTEAILKAVGNIKGLGSQALNATAGMYGTTQVFESAIPTLKLLGDTTKAVVSAIAAMGSALPFIGGLFTAADKATGAITSMVVAVASVELQMAQKYYDTYQQINKAGVGFSGSIGGLKGFLDQSGVSLGTFSRFLAASRDDLLVFGGGLELASKNVLNLGKGLAAADPKLLILMGGLDGLYGGIADYGASLARMGIDLAKQPELMKKGLSDYLYTLKEVETVTGMSVEQQRKANEARSTEILFQKRVQEIMMEDPTGGAKKIETVNAVISMMESQFGKDSMFVKTAKESFANRGQLVNPDTIGFAGMAQGLPEMLQSMFGAINKGGGTGDALKPLAAFINQQQGKLGSGALNTMASIIGADPSQTGPMRDYLTFLAVAGAKGVTVSKMLEAIKNAKEGRGAPVEDLTARTATALLKLEENQIAMDKHVAENLGKMANLAQFLTGLQTKLVEKFGPMVSDSLTLMSDLIDKLMGETDPVARNLQESRAAQAAASAASASRARGETTEQQTAAANAARIQSTRANPISAIRTELNNPPSGTGTPPPPGSGTPGSSGSSGANRIVTLDDLHKLGINVDTNQPGINMRGPIHPEMVKSLMLLKATGFVPPITSGAREGNGQGHSFPGGSKAIDFGVAGNTPERIALYVRTMRAALGTGKFKNLWFEDSSESDLMIAVRKELDKVGVPSSNLTGTFVNGASTGPHIHMEQFKYGGITDGPSIAGEDPSNPHEAVIPLPDGRTIPVNIDLSSLTDAINELIAINKDQLDMQNRIVQVSA